MKPQFESHRRGKATVGIVAGIVLVAAVAWIGYHFWGGSSTPPDNGRTIAEPFLDEIRNGRVDAAWESTSAEFKSAVGKEAFQQYVNAHPILKAPLELANFQAVVKRNTSCMECAYLKRDEPGNKGRVRVLIAQERGVWKVENLVAD